jgi:siderophore synthetase component
MRQRYFSMKEFMAFAVEVTGQVKLRWLALSGEVLNETDSAELQRILEEFFRKRNHHSFRKHGRSVNGVSTRS